MYKSILLFFLIFPIVILAQKQDKIIKKQLKDFEIFKTALTSFEAHPDRAISNDSLNYYLNLFQKVLSTEQLSNVSLYKGYAFITGLLQSGHTQVIPTKKVFKDYVLSYQSMPMDVGLRGNQLFVLKDEKLLPDEEFAKLSSKDKKKYELEENTQITAINGKPISEIVNELGSFVSSDENDEAFKYHLTKDLFDFYHFLIGEGRDSLTVSIFEKRDTVDVKVKAQYPPVKKISKRFKELEKETKKLEKDIGTFKLYNSKTGYFRFKSFYVCHGKKYDEFLEESFEKLNKREIKQLVVDLRGNTGGIMQYEFLSYLKQATDADYVGLYQVTNKKKPANSKYYKKIKLTEDCRDFLTSM